MVFLSSGSQCWYFSNEPSSLFHHSVLVDLNVSVMMETRRRGLVVKIRGHFALEIGFIFMWKTLF